MPPSSYPRSRARAPRPTSPTSSRRPTASWWLERTRNKTMASSKEKSMARHDSRMRTVLNLLVLATAVAIGETHPARAADDFADVRREIAARHDEALKRLQDWIALPSIAAESLNSAEGAERMAQLAREAGFQKVTIVPTDGKPGVFATLDAGAAKTVGLYFMYDVKQFDPAEWTSPPLEARLVDKRGLGKGM